VVLKADVERNELILKEQQLLAKQDVISSPLLTSHRDEGRPKMMLPRFRRLPLS
jgi:hypothetical protein